MKQTIDINIGGVVFQAEFDAYERLSKYLKDISNCFSQTEDSREIMQDIEDRVRDLLLEKNGYNKSIPITFADIVDVESIIGSVDDFKQNSDELYAEEAIPEIEPEISEKKESPKLNRRKLVRPRKGRKIGGICMGLSMYFDINVVIVRIIFLILLFFPSQIKFIENLDIESWVFLAYIVLWIAVPSSNKDIVYTNIEAKKKSLKKEWSQFREIWIKFKSDININSFGKLLKSGLSALGSLIPTFLNIFSKWIGIFIFTVSCIAVVVLAIVLGCTYFGAPIHFLSDHFNFTYTSTSLLWTFVFFVIPFLILMDLSYSLWHNKKGASGKLYVLAIIIWFVSFFASAKGFMNSHNLQQIFPSINAIHNNNVTVYNQNNGNSVDLDKKISPFSELSVDGQIKVRLKAKQDTVQDLNVKIHAMSSDVNSLSIENNSGKLEISLTDNIADYIEIEVPYSELKSIHLNSGAELSMIDTLKTDHISLTLDNQSVALMSIVSLNFDIECYNTSSISVNGKSDKSHIVCKNSSTFSGSDFKLSHSNIEASESATIQSNISKSIKGFISQSVSFTNAQEAKTNELKIKTEEF